MSALRVNSGTAGAPPSRTPGTPGFSGNRAFDAQNQPAFRASGRLLHRKHRGWV